MWGKAGPKQWRAACHEESKDKLSRLLAVCQATKLVTMKASSFQALGVGAKVVEVAHMLAKFVF